jgi:hypothetical protein
MIGFIGYYKIDNQHPSTAKVKVHRLKRELLIVNYIVELYWKI